MTVILVLSILACDNTPAAPKWLSSCSTTSPDVTCVNADSVKRTTTDKGEDQIICHWDCVEIGGDKGGPDSSPLAEPFTTGLDLVFQLTERSVDPDDSSVAGAAVYYCYEQVHAHRFDARCD